MEHFSPGAATVGGILIGVSATMLLAFSGRIAGISGILGALLPPVKGDTAWRVLFLLGLILGTLAYTLIKPGDIELAFSASYPVIVLGGLLVGFGTRLGGGCTSGHGVCGISRLSKRSLTATGVFMAAAFVTVFFTRHVVGG